MIKKVVTLQDANGRTISESETELHHSEAAALLAPIALAELTSGHKIKAIANFRLYTDTSLTAAKHAVELAQCACNSRQGELDELKDLNEGLNQRISTLIDEKAALENRSITLQRSLDGRLADIEALHDAVARVEAARARAEEDSSTAEAARARLERELKRAGQRIEELEDELDAARDELYEARESAEARITKLCLSLESLYSAIRTHKRLAEHFARIEDRQLWSNLPEERAKERNAERAKERSADDNS